MEKLSLLLLYDAKNGESMRAVGTEGSGFVIPRPPAVLRNSDVSTSWTHLRNLNVI